MAIFINLTIKISLDNFNFWILCKVTKKYPNVHTVT